MKTHIFTRTTIVLTIALLTCTLHPTQPAHAKGPKTPPITEEAGNCLSWPTIWADTKTRAPTVLGTFGDPQFDGATAIAIEEGTEYTVWLQQDLLNKWQAETLDWDAGSCVVNWIDWGDNLESKDWTTLSTVRVETVLFKDYDAMVGFVMKHVSGQGIDEMWGTTQATYSQTQPIVYSDNAYLTIQWIAKDSASIPPLKWVFNDHAWVLDTTDTSLDAPVVVVGKEASAEINIQGKVVYGYNWNLKNEETSNGEGVYRITFSFTDGTSSAVQFTDDATDILLPTEIAVIATEEGGGGGTAKVDPGNNLTYIDVRILPANGGDGGGGNGPGGPGGKSRR